MNITYTEEKQFNNKLLQMWKIEITIAYNHKKYVVKWEIFKFKEGLVRSFRNKIYTKERNYNE